MTSKSIVRPALSAFLLLFGLATIKSGGAVLFFDPAAEEAAGNYVDFVLWSNFVAGFFYAVAAIGIFFERSWSLKLTAVIALFTVGLLIAFRIHVLSGGAYENRTFWAMILRSFVWAGSLLYLFRNQKSEGSENLGR